MYLKTFFIYIKYITIILLTIILHLLSPGFTNADELIELQTRPGVTQSFILIKPANPIASVILFKGGDGILNLYSKSGVPVIGWGGSNFLVRSRNLFAKHGFMVAVVDTPSDAPGGMLYGFRTTDKHVTDIEHVIDYLKQQENIPVWLIGTSRGTESAAYIATRVGKKINGLVLTSSLTSDHKGTAVTSMELHKITVPTLVVSHKGDECWTTPPDEAAEIVSLLRNSPKKKFMLFEGGHEDPSEESPCRPLTHHGFLGIEEQVVSAIAKWIKRY